jgi:Holliday junction resolvase-like predicted endonuclease/predicted transcriptional regulator
MNLKEQILELSGNGMTKTEIAKMLNCASSTVSYHCSPEVKQNVIDKKRIRNNSKANVNNKSIFDEKSIDIIVKPVDWKCSEAICNLKLIELGYDTYIPFIGGGEIDLIATKDNVVYRIQIKSIAPRNKDSICIDLSRNSINYKSAARKKYENIDFFLIYDGTNIYKFDFDIKVMSITLRYTVPKNNQIDKIKMAHDYIFI